MRHFSVGTVVPSARACACSSTTLRGAVSSPCARSQHSAPVVRRSLPVAQAQLSKDDPPAPPPIDWEARRRKRLLEDLVEACQRRARLKPMSEEQKSRYERSKLERGIQSLELLLPGFYPNLESLPALQWAEIVTDTNAVAEKLVALKAYYPNLDLVDLLQKYPKVLTFDTKQLRDDAAKVFELLQRANNPEGIIQAVPELINAKILASVLITINKWYQLEKDPVQVLENDPDLIRRAQEVDQPFEPVYVNEDGSWMLPQLNYRERRADWQKYIDQTRYKQP